MEIAKFDDFAYNCLQRLNMRDIITDDELNYFFNNHPSLKNKTFMTGGDFMTIFKDEIHKARMAIANKDARTHAMN